MASLKSFLLYQKLIDFSPTEPLSRMRSKPWIDALIMRLEQENVSYMERDQLMYEKNGLETGVHWTYEETMSYFTIIEN